MNIRLLNKIMGRNNSITESKTIGEKISGGRLKSAKPSLRNKRKEKLNKLKNNIK